MIRIAAHFIHLYPGMEPKRIHYVELDNAHIFKGCYRLEQEVESAAFYNGILFVTKRSMSLSPSFLLEEFRSLQKANPSLSAFQIISLSGYMIKNPEEYGQPVDVFILDGLDLSSPEFRTDDGRSYGYIQRL